MSTDWHLIIKDELDNEIIPSTELVTLLIERDEHIETFSVCMDLSMELSDRLNLYNRLLYNLNYYSQSYPDNNFFLKDAKLIGVSYQYNPEGNNMHVEASWQYYREYGEFDYVNEIESTESVGIYDYRARPGDWASNIEYNFYLNDNIKNTNWKLFGF